MQHELKKRLSNQGAATPAFSAAWRCFTGFGKTKTNVPASEPLLEQAASIKARHSLSLADAWIAAAAQQVGATLLHKDPEFRAIANLPQEWLD